MEEWKEYRLGDVGIITTGKTPKTSVDEYYGGNIPFVTPADINTPYKYVTETVRYLTDKGLTSIASNSIDEGSICVSCIGNLGYAGIVQKRCASNQQINSITVRNEFDRDFVYYAIKRLWPLFKNHEGQSTTVSILNKGQFSKITIKCPSLVVQKRISSILSSLDDKIEVNRRINDNFAFSFLLLTCFVLWLLKLINDNLEQQAQALFKSWFVDFEPFKDGEFVESEMGMIPKGWRVKSLSGIADYRNGLAMQKFRPLDGEIGLPVLKIKELGQGLCDDSSELCSPSMIGEKYIINDGDIIFSWSGTLMVKLWCGGKCGLNQHLFLVDPQGFPNWFVYQWTKHYLDNFIRIAKDKAVTMGHIKRGELDKAKVVVPNEMGICSINALMEPLFKQTIAIQIESRRLAQLRDTLLPRLMSGELKVNELETIKQ